MSIERIERKDGSVVWRVRWRQAGQNRSKVLGRKRDAEAFDAELRRKRRTGELAALDAGKETLAEFGEEWWKLYAEPNLAASTLKVYAILWDTHVLPRLGSLRLREITPSLITNASGSSSRPRASARVSIRKSMTLLQGVLQRACEWDRSRVQPGARRPQAAGRSRPRRRATDAGRRRGDPRVAAGVRAAPRRDARVGAGVRRAATRRSARADLVARPRAHAADRGRGERRRDRARRRLGGGGRCGCSPPLGADLAEWRLRGGRPPDDALVFPGHDGQPWSPASYKNWHRRFFRPAIEAAGLAGARPYDLRHSFVSLLIAEGHNVVEVARQAGHSPKMALDTYAHVFEEFDPTQRVDAAERIRKARERLRERARQPTLFDVA